MGNATKILIIENNPSDIEFIKYELKKGGIDYLSEVVQNENDYSGALENFIPDIILSDYALPGFDGNTAFEIRKQIAPDTPFIFVSGTIGEERSIEYIKNGLTDYVLKDKLFTLTVKVKRALEEAKAKQEKIAAEKELIKSEMFFRALIEKSKEMITLRNREGGLMYASPSVTTAFGYPAEELNNILLYDVIHPDDIPELRKSRDKLLKQPGSSFDFQHRRKHKNGNWVWCEGTVTNMLNEPGVNAVVTNFRDISDRKRAEQDILTINESLKNALNGLQKIMDSSLDVICSIDAEGKFVKVSEASNTIWGYKPVELIGRKFIDFVFKDDLEKTLITDAGITNGFNVTVFENGYIHKNGNIVNMLWSANWDADDKIIYCIAKDTTEIKNAELQLRQSDAFTKGILNALQSHITVIDEAGNIITVNESWRRFGSENGVTTLQRCLEGTNYFDLCEQAAKAGDETAAEALRGFKDVMNGKIPQFYLEYPCHTKGKQLWFGMRVKKFESAKPMIVVSYLDISERKITERKLMDSESRLKEAQEIAQVGNFEMDMLNYTEVWSDEMFKILGIEKNAVIPSMQLFLSFIHPDELDYLQKGFSECMRTFQGAPFDFRFIRKDGSLRYGYTQAVFELSQDHKPIRLFGILQDVTEKKLAEIERAKMFNELQLRNSELEQFAYVASHDLQEPLRMITSFMTQLERKYGNVIDDKGKQYIHFAVDGAKRMREIILDLLNFSRVGKTEEELEEVDFNKLMNEIVALYRRKIEEEQASIVFENLPSIKTYKTPMRQVLQNLVDNGLKYCKTGEAPVIEIACTETAAHYQFSVKDNGIGMASEYFEKIFIIFQRLHNKNEYSGTGMGLSIVKKIIENLGGKIWVESEEGKGATFYFTIIKK